MASRKFGWHSGTLTCQDAKIQGDLFVQDDIVFSDVSAGVLGVTGGIDMQSTTSAIGIDMGGTFSTSAINIDGAVATGDHWKGINIDIDVPFLTVTNKKVYGMLIDMQQTSGLAAGFGLNGRLYGISSSVRVAQKVTNAYGIHSMGHIGPASTCTVNDVVGVYGGINISKPFTYAASTSSISALRGDIWDCAGASYNGQIFALFLGYAASFNPGIESALIFGYSHSNVYLDYGIHFVYNSTTQALATGIWLEAGTGSMTTGIDIGDCTTGITMADVTQVGINISMPVLTVGDSYSGVRVSVISAAPNNSYGTAAYFGTNLTGTQAGQFVYGIGSWININNFTAVAGRFLCAQDNGIYQGTDNGEIVDATLIFGVRMECLLASSDAKTYPFSINTSDDGITAIFEANGTDLGQVTDAGNDEGDLVPLFSRSGNTRYVKLYTLA